MCTAYVKRDGQMWPCGKCHNCRINRKRDWQARLLLEAASSAFSLFITLTIGVEDAKADSYCTYLDKGTVQRFLKRLRKPLPKGAVRYLIVGEYGTRAGRAHYHALIFSSVPLSQDLVSKAWGQGHVDFGDVQQESIDYCLACCLKSSDSDDTLSGDDALRRSCHPEFRLHSQGLGKAALPHLLVPDLETGELFLNREFRVLGRQWPIGRYFRQRVRQATLTELHERGQTDPVAEREDNRIERLLNEKLRSLPSGSAAYQEVRQQIMARREALVKQQQARRIRDYYRDLHKLNDRGRKNETF